MTHSNIPPTRINEALGQVEKWQSENPIPGLSVTFVVGTDVVASQGFGERDLDTKHPMTETTRIPVGSLTKPITALATLSLLERTGISVEAPVRNYVQYFDEAPGEPITIQELLSHTSGMPDDDLALVGEEVNTWEAFGEFLAGTLDRRLVDQEQFLYYNSGYAVLTRLIEVVSDMEFPSFVQDEIFAPLEMGQSGWDYTVFDSDSVEVITPYSVTDGDYQAESLTFNPVLAGVGGLVTTVEDMASFLIAYLDEESPIQSDLLRQTHSPVARRKGLVDGTEYSYGFGWEIEPFGSDRLIGHSGNVGVAGGYMGFLLEEGIGIAVGFNGQAETDPVGLARKVLATLTGIDPTTVDHVENIEQKLQSLTGRYHSYTGAHVATVEWDAPCLEISLGGDLVDLDRTFIPIEMDPGRYRFTSTDNVESTTDLEVIEAGGEFELVYDQLLLRCVQNDQKCGE